VRDPEVLASYLEDAAHVPGGHLAGAYSPSDEVDVARIVRTESAVLPIGAQSSLTGGATPMGDAVITTARLRRIEHLSDSSVRVQAGVSLQELESALTRIGRYYPPASTFPGAFVGGTVSTNAAGAATFKYGTTRRWVEGLTVVLANGDVLDVERGATRAHPDGYFELELTVWRSSRSGIGRRRSRSCSACVISPCAPGRQGTLAASTSRPWSTWTDGRWSCCGRTASIVSATYGCPRGRPWHCS